MKEIIMPKFGFTQETSEIVAWKVKEGDQVEAGDILAEVTTDKITMEVETPEAGTIAGIRYKQGDIVPVTEIIAYILKPGESVPAEKSRVSQNGSEATRAVPGQLSPSSKNGPSELASGKVTPLAARVAAAQGIDITDIPGSGPRGRVTRWDVEHSATQHSGNGKLAATPAAKRLAREIGIPLGQVEGSGPNGRIQEADVRSFSELDNLKPRARSASESPQSMEIRRIPFTGMRKAIAMNMALSAQTIPAIQLEIDVDMERTLVIWNQAKARAGDMRVSLTACLMKAVAWALTRHPMLNSQLEPDEILLLPEVNIGLAVALENGLIVPVIHRADGKAILDLAKEINDVSERARQAKLRTSDLEGATFTISNLGMFGVDRFTALINPPQVAILAVSAMKKQFIANEAGQPILRSVLNMRLSADHRVVDGATAARFLSDLRAVLENPEEMLL